jgi:heavy metal sensor kinase
MRLVPRSVRVRLTLWYALALTLLVVLFSAGIYLLVQARLYRELDREVSRKYATIERVYRDEPGELSELDPHGSVALFQVLEDGKILHETEGWKESGFAQALATRGSSPSWSWSSSKGRAYRLRVGEGTTSAHRYEIALAEDEGGLRKTLRILAITFLVGAPFAALLSVAGGYFLAGRILSPIGAMARKAEAITAESLSERLPVENAHDEFGRLATVFNDTLSRLHHSFEQLRRFTADASHELRTPLTAMRSVGEVALQDTMGAPAYRDVIGSMLEEVDRLTRLVESLLTLTRAESGRTQPVRKLFDLGPLAGSVADTLRVLSEEKNQTLRFEEKDRLRVEGDPDILRQAVVNVLDNAIKYTPEKGFIEVAVRRTGKGEAALEIRDSGPGIGPEHRERIFDRFYRVDPARSHDTGGVGLGLSIAKWAVGVNGGRIELESETGKGSLFRIVLPELKDRSPEPAAAR